ncbi:CYFA0S06e02058g1_1 [Cyberlindnera fabianii]|uniref:COMPASS component SDC1 n=1 Tax=Cyberlindnera fabianii TaxID=36022 RepID=A0A061AU86_CYBFA|nr:COMPASS component SDC1 [Cyberlindnera fabianii]CDR41119.1 CYFA0S06e02058g1_1 [Cyberlindnera fabianii]
MNDNSTQPVADSNPAPIITDSTIVDATPEATPEAGELRAKQENLSIKTEGTPIPTTLSYNVPTDAGAPHEVIGGAPVRKWLNEHVTPSLLEGVRLLAKEKPDEPLKVLGEWLIKKNEEGKN